jgi:hypothetical protein
VKKWTIMIIPQDRGSSRTFTWTSYHPWFLGFLNLCIILAVSFFLVRVGTKDSIEKDISSALKKANLLIDRKAQELEDLGKKSVSVKEEIEHQEKIANLKKEEADAVRSEIELAVQKGRHFDYFIAFILGVLSSALVTFIALLYTGKIGRRLSEAEKNDILRQTGT